MSFWNLFRRRSATSSSTPGRSESDTPNAVPAAPVPDTVDPATEALARQLMAKAAKSTGMSVDKLNELIGKYGDGSEAKLEDDDPGGANYSVDAIQGLLDRGSYEEALLDANGSIRNGSNDPEIHRLKINALMFLDRDEEAIEFGNRSLEQWPNSVDLNCILGCANNKLRRLDRAREHFEAAIRQQPTHTRSLIGLGDCLAFGHDFASAVPCYDRAIDIDLGEASRARGRQARRLSHQRGAGRAYPLAP